MTTKTGLGWLAGFIAGASGGCLTQPEGAGFDRPDPPARLRAIQEAASADDRETLKDLIRSLDSDDPAERLLSIRALEHRTGQTFGYDHSARRNDREEAMKKWVEWFERGGGTEKAAAKGG